jgi:hypothetical protein
MLKVLYQLYPEAIRTKSADDRLPLHEIMTAIKRDAQCTPTGEKADKLRLLLKYYPVAVRSSSISSCLPLFDKWETHKHSNYFTRILLRAAPEMEPVELRELNYQARRGALYLLFSTSVLTIPSDEGGERIPVYVAAAQSRPQYQQ